MNRWYHALFNVLYVPDPLLANDWRSASISNPVLLDARVRAEELDTLRWLRKDLAVLAGLTDEAIERCEAAQESDGDAWKYYREKILK
jgi:hypothetical protein